MFEEAEAAGEVVSPPAGAIGRGDAFLLRIAEKAGATVLSNDSFQEFHGEHQWLFDDGRLIGGKPVPGVGWIFLPRTPVRGQKSREVVKEAKRKKRADDDADGAASETRIGSGRVKVEGPAQEGGSGHCPGHRGGGRAEGRRSAPGVAPPASRPRRRSTSRWPSSPSLRPIRLAPRWSEPSLEFSSHGAFVQAGGARCYLPLSAMGDPPPRRAREVVGKGEERVFVVQALDPQRRGIELALPGYARIAGGPTEETVEAEIHPTVRSRAQAPASGEGRAGRQAMVGRASADEDRRPAIVGGSPAAGRRRRRATGPPDEPAGVRGCRPRPDAGRRSGQEAPAGKKAAPAEEAAPGTAAGRRLPREGGPVKKAAGPGRGRARAAAGKGRPRPEKAAAHEEGAPARSRRPGRPVKKAAPASQPASPPAAEAGRREPAIKVVPAKKSAGPRRRRRRRPRRRRPPRSRPAAPPGSRREPGRPHRSERGRQGPAKAGGATSGVQKAAPSPAGSAVKAKAGPPAGRPLPAGGRRIPAGRPKVWEGAPGQEDGRPEAEKEAAASMPPSVGPGAHRRPTPSA